MLEEETEIEKETETEEHNKTAYNYVTKKPWNLSIEEPNPENGNNYIVYYNQNWNLRK